MLLTWSDRQMNFEDGSLVGFEADRLTPTETRVLRYLGEHLGSGVSIEELEREVWGFAPNTRSRTAQVTLRRLRRELEVVQRLDDGTWTLQRPTRPTDLPTHPLLPREQVLARMREALEQGWRRIVLRGPPGSGRTCLAASFLARESEVVWVDRPRPGERLPTSGWIVLRHVADLPDLPSGAWIVSIGGPRLPSSSTIDVPVWSEDEGRALLGPEVDLPPEALRIPGILMRRSATTDWTEAAASWLEEACPDQATREDLLLLVAGGGSLDADRTTLLNRDRQGSLLRAGWLRWDQGRISVHPAAHHVLTRHPGLERARTRWATGLVDELDALYAVYRRTPRAVTALIRARVADYREAVPLLPDVGTTMHLLWTLSRMTSEVGGAKLPTTAHDLLVHWRDDQRARIFRSAMRFEPLDEEIPATLEPRWQLVATLVSRIFLWERPLRPLPVPDDRWSPMERVELAIYGLFECPEEALVEQVGTLLGACREDVSLGILTQRIAAGRLLELGRPLDGVPWLEDALASAREHDLLQLVCFLLDQLATLQALPAPGRAERLWKEAEDTARTLGYARMVFQAIACQGLTRILQSDLDGGLALIDEALSTLGTTPSRELATIAAVRVAVLAALGRHDEARRSWKATSLPEDELLSQLAHHVEAVLDERAPDPHPLEAHLPLSILAVDACHRVIHRAKTGEKPAAGATTP